MALEKREEKLSHEKWTEVAKEVIDVVASKVSLLLEGYWVSGIEKINPTEVNDWWEVIESTCESSCWCWAIERTNIEKKWWYCFLWKGGEISYLRWFPDFWDIKHHNNTIYYFKWWKVVLSNGIKDEELDRWFENTKVVMNNWRWFLLMTNTLWEDKTESLYDLDNMKLLLNNVVSIQINQENNSIEYIEDDTMKNLNIN